MGAAAELSRWAEPKKKEDAIEFKLPVQFAIINCVRGGNRLLDCERRPGCPVDRIYSAFERARQTLGLIQCCAEPRVRNCLWRHMLLGCGNRCAYRDSGQRHGYEIGESRTPAVSPGNKYIHVRIINGRSSVSIV